MARTTINSLGIPADTIVSADLDYPLTGFSSTGITDNATSTALTIDSSGNIAVTGTIDGRDLAADGTKLDGLPATATDYDDTDVASYLSTNGYDTATNIVATITDSAPLTLDTLNELAAALGDDPNFASTVTSSLALKADTSSLSTIATTGAYSDLTGTPTLATVATSGSYNDLTDQPVIAAGYTNSDVDMHLNTSTATTDQILKWTGSDYSWVADSGGATEDAFYENSQTLGANVTISAGRNAMTTGPLTVGTGFSVTIESGCRVVII